MISVASLLNPTKAESRSTHASSGPSSINYTSSSLHGSFLPSQPVAPKPRMAKDGAIFTPGKTKGEVNFPPFEDLCESDALEIEKHHVYPLGSIKDCPRHIPYNSDKKSFLEKTSRESFEVFQYEFKLIREDKTYTVMWDYNIGLVRITPFFKCCKYSKTTPAKMLNLNPGLKEVTHSITGGALVAQGYWMPYSCALAVCATFCAHISVALIPIFGPTFPAKCIPTSHQSYGTMVIEPSIIAFATTEAESFRLQYSTASPSSSVMKVNSTSPRESQQDADSIGLQSPTDLNHRPKLKRTFTNASIYTDAENSDTSASSRDRYPYSPATPTSSYNSHGWTPDNTYSTPPPKRPNPRNILSSFHSGQQSAPSSTSDSAREYAHGLDHSYGHRPTLSYGASPWLSAIPRSIAYSGGSFPTTSVDKATPAPFEIPSQALRRSTRQNFKTRDTEYVSETDHDRGYDGEDDGEEESPSSSVHSGHSQERESSQGMEKKAAWLLMNLSVRDGTWAVGNDKALTATSNDDSTAPIAVPAAYDRLGDEIIEPKLTVENSYDSAPKAKRRRATTM